jgi:alkylhydroperoxidase family enzyme
VSGLAQVEWEECLLEPRRNPKLEREVRRTLGLVPGSVRYFEHCPWLVRALARSNLQNGQLVHVELELADLVFLAVSQDSSCRYCYASQRAQLRIMGFDEGRIRRLEEASFLAEGDRRERLALDFARRVSRAAPAPSEADREALLEAGFSDGAIRELAYVAAQTVAANRNTTLIAVPLDSVEGLETRWSTRLLRPFIARTLRSRRRPGKPERLAPELREGPFAYVSLALDGLPAARIGREIFQEAWHSPILPPRVKALVFAVVARGLASERAEREATELLAPLGLDRDDVGEVLAHLTSPKLDALEEAALPFARESIRYRPVEIQRRGRGLREKLNPAEFLELVGVIGLANALVRLSLVLCEEG